MFINNRISTMFVDKSVMSISHSHSKKQKLMLCAFTFQLIPGKFDVNSTTLLFPYPLT